MVPRYLIVGRTYLVTRRCSERRFFLRPGRKTNKIVRYAITKAAHIWGVEVHAWTVMSNHLHIVATDPQRELPNFMHIVDLEISKAVSAEIGRWGGLWEPGESYSSVELCDVDAIIEKIAYVLANPVSAGLVRRATRWPGETSVKMVFGEVVVAYRPDTAYYRNSRQPERYEIRLAPPPGIDPVECLERARARIREIETQQAETMRREGRKWLGERRVLEQDPYDSPSSWEKRRGIRPTFASRDKWKRIETAQRRSWWLAVYRAALERFRQGVHDVVFPYGTWGMERIYGCNCAPAPT
jgi:REP element-mobilizing transposase RayT